MKWVWNGILFVAFFLAACGDGTKSSSGNGVSCGPGTVQRDGACVPESQAGLECGDGTVEEDGRCVPETEGMVECGEGTVEEDGVCVPETEGTVECGEGTVEEDGVCVPEGGLQCGEGTVEKDGQCVPAGGDPVCGDGTILEDGACVPDGSELCEPGTIFDAASGHCKLDPTACASGTVFLAGECVPEGSALEADHEENPEPNDPGGAGAFDAPALGAVTTAHGCVTPEEGESDFDVWSIEADAPMVLEIAVAGVGGLGAGFVVLGPAELPGYQRYAFSLTSDTAHRQVYLPVAGTYSVYITSALTLLQGIAAGGPDSCYYATFEHVAPPASTPLVTPAHTGTDSGNVRILKFTASSTAQILDIVQTSDPAQVSTAFVTLKNGVFYGHSVQDGNAAKGLVAGLEPSDDVEIVVDMAYNLSTLPADYALDSAVFSAQPLPTGGTAVTATKKNGSFPQHPTAERNYFYFDVPTDGQVVRFDLTSTVPLYLSILRERILDSNLGFDTLAPIDSTGPGTSSFSGAFVRFLQAGRYYLAAFDPLGSAESTYEITSSLSAITPAALDYGVEMAGQSLSAGSAFYALDLTDTERWIELKVSDVADWGVGEARVSLYDLSGEGWLNTTYLPLQTGTQPGDGSVPQGRVVLNDTRDYLVRIESTGAPGSSPTFSLTVDQRPHVYLGTITAGADIIRLGQDVVPASGALRYLVEGAAPDDVEAVVTPNVGSVDIRLERLNADESNFAGVTGTSDVGGAGTAESLLGALLKSPDWFAFTVANKDPADDTTLNTTLAATAPTGYEVTTTSLPYADACPGGSVIALSDADEAVSDELFLPASFSDWKLYGDTVGTLPFRLRTNGFLSFDGTTTTNFANQSLPLAGAPNGVIAPYWDDLHQVVVCRKDDAVASTVTLQWTGELFNEPGKTVAVQVVLHLDGSIDFIYAASQSATGQGATIGVENLFGSAATLIGFNEAGSVVPGTSITLTPE